MQGRRKGRRAPADAAAAAAEWREEVLIVLVECEGADLTGRGAVCGGGAADCLGVLAQTACRPADLIVVVAPSFLPFSPSGHDRTEESPPPLH